MRIIVIPTGGDFASIDRPKSAAIVHTIEVVSHLAVKHKVILFIEASNRDIIERSLPETVIVKFLPHSTLMPLAFLIRYFILPFYFIASFLSINADVVYIRLSSFTFASVVAARLTGKKYVMEVNGVKRDEILVSHKKSLIRFLSIFFVSLLERFSYSPASAIVAVTHGIRDSIIRTYNIQSSKISVISNGANVDLFKPVPGARYTLGYNQNVTLIGFVGNLYAWQGVECLLRAIPELMKHDSTIHVVIVGTGAEEVALKQTTRDLKVEKHVTFTGVIEYKKIPLYINAFDVCVAPWIAERNSAIGLSPLKLYEYLSCGKPVVASRIVGIVDILKENDVGLCVPPDDYYSIAQAVISLLNNPHRMHEMGQRGRDLVVEKYSWKVTAEKVLHCLKRAVEH